MILSYSSYNLHNSYNLHSSYNLHNSYNLLNSYGKVNFLKHIRKPIKHFLYIFFFLYIKIRTKYYQKNKERLQKEACERYQNLSEVE